MDQSEALHLQSLPVVDWPEFTGWRVPAPTAAQAAAAILAAHAPAPAGGLVGSAALSDAVRARLEAARGRPMNEPPEGPPTRDQHRRNTSLQTYQAAEWTRADRRLRAALVNWAGLRALHPGRTMHELGDRAWVEIPDAERAALGSALRVLRRLMADMPHIAAEV